MNTEPIALKNLAKIVPGYPFRGKIDEAPGSSVTAVQMKDASHTNGINWGLCIETELPGKRQPYWLSPNDILVAARGNKNYAVRVGEGLGGRQAVASPHFFVVSITDDKLDPEYLEFVLNHGPCQNHFRREAEGSLTKSIRRPVLENAPIPLLPLEKQRSIVGIANTIQRERAIAQNLIHNGEKLLNALANELHHS